MAGEALAGIVSLKRAAFDLAQEIKEIDDAARRGANVCLRRHKLSQSRLVQSNPASRPELDIIQGRVRMQSRDTAGGPRLRRARPIDVCTGAAHLHRERSQQIAAARAVAGPARLL